MVTVTLFEGLYFELFSSLSSPASENIALPSPVAVQDVLNTFTVFIAGLLLSIKDIGPSHLTGPYALNPIFQADDYIDALTVNVSPTFTFDELTKRLEDAAYTSNLIINVNNNINNIDIVFFILGLLVLFFFYLYTLILLLIIS